jgi:hypothetical protein
MPTRGKIVVLLLSAAALLGLSSLNATARIVCNSDGDCWHVHEDYDYPPAARLHIHPDTWRWDEGQHFVWKEHPGRGYWRGDEWRGF